MNKTLVPALFLCEKKRIVKYEKNRIVKYEKNIYTISFILYLYLLFEDFFFNISKIVIKALNQIIYDADFYFNSLNSL